MKHIILEDLPLDLININVDQNPLVCETNLDNIVNQKAILTK